MILYNIVVKQICPNCLYIGKPKYSPTDSFRLPMAGFFLGITFYWVPLELFSSFVINYDSLFLISGPFISALIGGLLIISYYKRHSKLCPKCGYGNMISTDTPEAHNLAVKSRP